MTQPDPAVPHPDPDRQAGQAMAQALAALLDRVPQSRRVLPYLGALETGLAAEGLAVLGVIPLPSLQRMGAQLASLPIDAADRPLRALQVQLLAALTRRGEQPVPAPAPAFMPTGLGEDQLEVIEVGDTDWDDARHLFAADGSGGDAQPR